MGRGRPERRRFTWSDAAKVVNLLLRVLVLIIRWYKTGGCDPT
jgi:hypothetical protein